MTLTRIGEAMANLPAPTLNKSPASSATARPTEEERIDEEVAKSKRDAGLTARLAGYTFENFEAPRQQAGWDAAQDFLGQPAEALILHGPYGTGKTHLAAAVAHRYIEQDPVIHRRGWYDPSAGRWRNSDGAPGGRALFVVLPDLLRELRGAMRDYGDDSEAAMIRRCQRTPLLILDDLGRNKPSRWAQETLYSIVNWRYNYRLPLVATTNLQPSEFVDNVGGGTTDRLIEMATIVEMAGDSYRLEAARKARR